MYILVPIGTLIKHDGPFGLMVLKDMMIINEELHVAKGKNTFKYVEIPHNWICTN